MCVFRNNKRFRSSLGGLLQNQQCIMIGFGEGYYTVKKPWASKYSVVQNTFEWRRENALGIYIFATLASLWLVGYDTWSRLADKRYNEFMIGPLPNLQLPCKKRCFENEKRTEAKCFSKVIGVIPYTYWAFKLKPKS